MTIVFEIKTNRVIESISDALREKGIIFDQSTASMLFKIYGDYKKILKLESIVDDTAIFLSSERLDNLQDLLDEYSTQDVLRVKSLLEEIYERPIKSMQIFDELSELQEYKETEIEEILQRKELEELLRSPELEEVSR